MSSQHATSQYATPIPVASEHWQITRGLHIDKGLLEHPYRRGIGVRIEYFPVCRNWAKHAFEVQFFLWKWVCYVLVEWA